MTKVITIFSCANDVHKIVIIRWSIASGSTSFKAIQTGWPLVKLNKNNTRALGALSLGGGGLLPAIIELGPKTSYRPQCCETAENPVLQLARTHTRRRAVAAAARHPPSHARAHKPTACRTPASATSD